jgi:TonB-linked SusC/RagA family outer membrane protein
MQRSKLIIIFLLSFFYFSGYGQNSFTISGKIIDKKSGELLIGASVKDKGTQSGTITNSDGEFSIITNTGHVLEISYVGYITDEITVKGKEYITIELTENVKALDEVIVIGYGVQRKSDLTGAVSSISGDEIKNIPVASALQALQGKASGVQIIQNTGSPGSSTTIKIRGTGTINDSDPLYVVDGFVMESISHINPNDIASIEILKDAASAAIYGSRSANGVVLVTTKSGESGKLKIDFDSNVGFSNPWKTIDVLSIEDFALMRDYVDGTSYYSVDGKLYYSKEPNTSDYYFDNNKFQRIDTIARNSPSNWLDAVTQTGLMQQYNLSMSTGTDKNKYLISANYYDEKGIVKKSAYNKFSTRFNATNEVFSWLTAQSNVLYTYESRDLVPEGTSGILKQALYQSPLTYTYNNKGYWYSAHPVSVLERYHNNIDKHRIDMNVSLTAKINKLLTYQFKLSDFVSFSDQDRFIEVNKLESDFNMPTDLSSIYKYQTFINKWEINNLLTFNWNNHIHNINSIVGQTIEKYNYDYHYALRKGTDGNDENYRYLSAGYTGDQTRSDDNKWSAIGFVGRVNYSLLDRYLVQVNFRTDASSKFSEQNRWGYFPSVSLGWKFTSEPFMKNAEWISLGKLRVGWGKLGNNRINTDSRFTVINSSYNYVYGTADLLYPGATATTIGNPDIRWEKTETYNIGLDMNFFNNKLNTTVEIFDKYTTDMLLQVPVTLSAGLEEAPMANAGSVRNYGIELNMTYKSTVNKNLSYSAGFNISYIRNTVLSLGNNNEPVWGGYLSEASIQNYVTKTEVGRPIGTFYGYVTDGIFNTQEEVENSPQAYDNTNIAYTTAGCFRFKDLNGDRVINSDDRTYLGSPLPDFIFGIPVSVNYKEFELSVFFQGQAGNKIFNVMEYYLNSAHGTGNVYADIRSNHWSGGTTYAYRTDRSFFPENINATVPDLSTNDAAKNFRGSDFYIKDGSYLRLKNIQLSYNCPESLLKNLKLRSLTFYVGAYNLLTFTKYNGLDPEVGKVIGTESNGLNIGIDHGNFPQARMILSGIKIGL